MIICINRFRISVCILFACLLFSVSTHPSACAYPGVLTLSQYSQASDTTAPRPLSLKLVAVYPSNPEDAYLPAARAIRNIAIDTTGNVYVADSRNHRLLSFNPDGEMRWSVGQRGMGPGDLNRPVLTTDGQNKLYVYHKPAHRVDVFDMEGRYLNTLMLPSDLRIAASQIFYTEPDDLVLIAATGDEYSLNAFIFKLKEDEMHFSRQITIKENPAVVLGTGYYDHQPAGVIGAYISTGSVQHHQFLLTDLNGRTVDSLSRELHTGIRPYIEIDPDDFGAFLDEFGKSYPLMKVNESLFLHTYEQVSGDNRPDKKEIYRKYITENKLPDLKKTYSIELLDKDFNIIAIQKNEYFTTPDSGKVIATDGKGHIYTVKSGRETTIRKYRLEY